MSFQIEEDTHFDGVGLVYFSKIRDMIARTELNALPELIGSYPMRNRRTHFFGNLDVEDRLEITARASDQPVIACAESIYGFS